MICTPRQYWCYSPEKLHPSKYEHIVMSCVRLQIELSTADELDVVSGDYWGFLTTNGVIAYKTLPIGSHWCGVAGAVTPTTTSAMAPSTKEYAISVGYSTSAGENLVLCLDICCRQGRYCADFLVTKKNQHFLFIFNEVNILNFTHFEKKIIINKIFN